MSKADEKELPILRELHAPNDQSLAVDLVFVHGLGGDYLRTWTADGNSRPWIEDPKFLGPLAGRVRVLSFGYNANRFGEVANTRIIHHANSMLRALLRKRIDCPDRPIIFIAHSLGGLVVKRAILLCPTNTDWYDIKSATKAILFLGTPHLGSGHAAYLNMAQNFLSWVKLEQAVATNLTQELEAFSTAVQDINQEFSLDVHRSIKLICFFESEPQRLPNGKKAIIVPQWSAMLQGVESQDLSCTHSALPKFKTPTEGRFENFWGEVQRCVRKAETGMLAGPTREQTVAEPTGTPSSLAPSATVEETPVPTAIPASRALAPLAASCDDPILGPIRVRTASLKTGITVEPHEASPQATLASATMPRQSRPLVGNAVQDTRREYKTLKDDPSTQVKIDKWLSLFRKLSTANLGLEMPASHQDTCGWILDNSVFREWLQSTEKPALFVTGPPGCGKSHVAKHIVDWFQQQDDDESHQNTVLYFFCDSVGRAGRDPPILEHFVRSLLNRDKSLRIHVVRCYEAALDTAAEPSVNSLLHLLRALLSDPLTGPTTLLVDGLDQCSDKFVRDFLQALDQISRLHRALDTKSPWHRSRSALQQQAPPPTRFLITCRQTQVIRGYAAESCHIEVKPETVSDDIRRVVEDEVRRIFVARAITGTESSSLANIILERAQGDFLYATSVLDELWKTKDTDASAISGLLRSCPPNVQAVYQKDLCRLESERPDLAALVQTVLVSLSPLRSCMAKDALRFWFPHLTSGYDLEDEVRRECPNLLRVGPSREIELRHHTVREFLKANSDEGRFHMRLAEACLRYLTAPNWRLVWSSIRHHSELHPDALLASGCTYWFFNYAARFLHIHIKSAGRHAADIMMTIDEFYRAKSMAHYGNWAQAFMAITGQQPSEGWQQRLPPVVVFFKYDLDVLVQYYYRTAWETTLWERILSRFVGHSLPGLYKPPTRAQGFRTLVNETRDHKGQGLLHLAARGEGRCLGYILPFVDDIDVLDPNSCTALMIATSAESLECVRILLGAGANVNRATHTGITCLHLACERENIEIARVLLEAAADAKSTDNDGAAPISVAVRKNNASLTKLLLDYGADIAQVIESGFTPILLAMVGDANDALRVLLPRIRAGDPIFAPQQAVACTPLHAAIIFGRMDLLDHFIYRIGVDLCNPVGEPYETPVWLAVDMYEDFPEILPRLIAAGASVDAAAPGVRSPLSRAVDLNYRGACVVLLRAGCDIDALDGLGETALTLACQNEHMELVDLLVDEGADPLLGRDPPLHIASRLGNSALLTRIVKAGGVAVDFDKLSSSGETALGLACLKGHLQVAKYLLAHGADPNVRHAMETPLWWATKGDHPEVALELVAHGADPTPLNASDNCPLHVAARKGHLALVKAMLDAAEDPSVLAGWEIGKYGYTPLSYAAMGGHFEVAQLLLSLGAAVRPAHKTDGQPDRLTYLTAAAAGGNLKLFDLLSSLSGTPLDANERDSSGRTALMYACAYRSVAIVLRLLELGADPTLSIPGLGQTAFHIAAQAGAVDILDLLVSRVAVGGHDQVMVQLTRQNEPGNTPLVEAACAGQLDMVCKLISLGVDVNDPNQPGMNALLGAICQGKDDVVQTLLSLGADPGLRDIYGRNALHVAATLDAKRIQVLLAFADRGGCLTSAETIFGRRPTDHMYPTNLPMPPRAMLVDIVVRLTDALLSEDSRDRPNHVTSAMWGCLGRTLLFMGDESAATSCYQRGCKPLEMNPGVITNPCFWCDGCQNRGTIQGTVHICRSCDDCSVCETCVGRYRAGDRTGFSRACAGHDFFAVPFRILEGGAGEGIGQYSGVDATLRPLLEETRRRCLSEKQSLQAANDGSITSPEGAAITVSGIPAIVGLLLQERAGQVVLGATGCTINIAGDDQVLLRLGVSEVATSTPWDLDDQSLVD